MKYKKTFEDVTEEWFRNATPNSHKVIELNEITICDVVYKVDGINVIFDAKPNEYKVAVLIEKVFGGRVAIRPRITIPQGIRSADFEIGDELFDLKTPEGNGKHTLYGMVKGNSKQAVNYIFDISKCGLTESQAIEQIEDDIYRSVHTKFVDKIILINNDKVIKVYKRK